VTPGVPSVDRWCQAILCAALLCMPAICMAHAISDTNARFVEAISGPAIVPFLYLGAKHMVTGYDHLLFLVGVVFFLYRPRDVVLYVSMFTLGHSLTLLLGVFAGLNVNPYIIDGIIGLSVVYKAFENLGGFARLGWSIDTRMAVFAFGLTHGLGLATKVLDLTVAEEGLVTNIVSFNVGVEIGQLLVLAFVIILLNEWRRSSNFPRHAAAANVVLMSAGFGLAGYQFAGLLLS
jgi:hypothetical protein